MKKLKHLITLLIIGQSALSGCSLFSSAVRQANQKARAQLYYVQHPGELAGECVAQFPVIPLKVDTGKISFKADTIFRADTGFRYQVIAPGQAGNFIRIGPEADTVITRTDTVFRTITRATVQVDTVSVEDTAVTDSLQSDNARLTSTAAASQQQLVDANATCNSRLWIIIGLAFVALVLAVAFVTKLF